MKIVTTVAAVIFLVIVMCIYLVFYLFTLPTPRRRVLWVRHQHFGHWN